MSGVWFEFSLSISPYLYFNHTATYSQFSNHCYSVSHWYVKPPHCQDMRHKRMNGLHVSSQQWHGLGHIQYGCGAYIVRTLTMYQYISLIAILFWLFWVGHVEVISVAKTLFSSWVLPFILHLQHFSVFFIFCTSQSCSQGDSAVIHSV